MFTPPKESILLETSHWRIHHNIHARLQGYLMIGALGSEVNEFSDVSSEGLAEFGEIVAAATNAIKTTFNPKHIFVSRYGVMPGNLLHLHVIPVYDWLEDRIRRDERYSFLSELIDVTWGTDYDAADFLLYTWRELVEHADTCGIPPVDIPKTVARMISNLRSERGGDGDPEEAV